VQRNSKKRTKGTRLTSQSPDEQGLGAKNRQYEDFGKAANPDLQIQGNHRKKKEGKRLLEDEVGQGGFRINKRPLTESI